jgi:glycosyltransferase involved in cell wall biosynthesis
MKMLFLRDFRGATGGHLKYWDYLEHTKRIPGIEPELYLTPGSLTDMSNPFLTSGVPIREHLTASDSYFVAGLDWKWLDAAGIDLSGKPVINLVQHVLHADPTDPKFTFLARPALRICVSAPVAEALSATGRVTGPIVTIENGIEIGHVTASLTPSVRSGVFIAGYKAPDMGRAIAVRLRQSVEVDLAEAFVPRDDFLRRVARARLCVLLPNAKEGFYLPALEAMALGTPVIVPDCIGNRSFCIDGVTCLAPQFSVSAISQAAMQVHDSVTLAKDLVQGGYAMAKRHSLDREEEQYTLALLNYLGL